MGEGRSIVKVSRRTALQFVASGVGAVAFAACAPAAPSASSTTGPASTGSATSSTVSTSATTATTSATPQPRPGGTLRYGSVVDINRLDPHFRLSDVYYAVYDRLTQYDLNHTPQPMLAESWDIAPDYMSITFHLRKGVTFHNGAQLDAAAVKFNSERARDLVNTQLDEAKWWTEIDTPDSSTVVFKSDKPRPLAFDYFEYLNIAEPTTANDAHQAIGTGPFKFVEWKPNQSFTLTKNPDYWQTGKPLLDGIVMSVLSDPQAMVVNFEGGNLDVAVQLPVDDFIRLKADPSSYTAYSFLYGNFSCLGVQCQVPPWDNKQARQALTYAVDRDRWANTVLKGLETASTLPWTQSSPAYDATKGKAYSFDLAKAQSLLKAAGVTGTFNQDILIQSGNNEYASFAQIVQSDMANLGLTLNIKALDGAPYLDAINNWKYQGLYLSGGSFAQLDPGTSFTKSRAISPTGNSSAFTTPANAAAVALVNQATSEIDPNKRKQIYSDLNDMLLDEVYIIGMSPTVNRVMTTSKVQGIAETLHSAVKWWEVWLSA